MTVNTPESPKSNSNKYSEPIPTPYENDNTNYTQNPNQQPIIDQEIIYNNLTPEKSKGLSKKAIATIASLLGISIMAATFFGINSGNDKNIPNRPVATSPANPAETANPSISLEQRTEQYKDAMEKYELMSIDEFNQLPIDERLLYSEYIVDTTKVHPYDIWYKIQAPESKVDIVPASINNTNQEILNYYLYIRQISNLQYVNDLETYDPNDGIKVLSSIYYFVDDTKLVSNDYLLSKNAKEQQTALHTVINKYTAKNDINSKVVEINGLDGYKQNGKIIPFTDSYHDEGGAYEDKIYDTNASFIYHKYTSYYGVEKSVWLLNSVSDNLNSLN